MCTRIVTRTGIETLKEVQLMKNKLIPSMKSPRLHQNKHKRPPCYNLSHIPELLNMPMLKSYQEWPVSAQLFWSEQRQIAHAAEQLNGQQRLEVRPAEEAGDGGDQNGEDGSE